MRRECTSFLNTPPTWADSAPAPKASTALLAEAARGLFAVMVANPDAVRATDETTFHLDHRDPEELLHDRLAELLFAFHSRRVVFAEFETRVQPSGLTAVACGEPIDLRRHELDAEVKAITWHGLRVEQNAGQWMAEVIVDFDGLETIGFSYWERSKLSEFFSIPKNTGQTRPCKAFHLSTWETDEWIAGNFSSRVAAWSAGRAWPRRFSMFTPFWPPRRKPPEALLGRRQGQRLCGIGRKLASRWAASELRQARAIKSSSSRTSVGTARPSRRPTRIRLS